MSWRTGVVALVWVTCACGGEERPTVVIPTKDACTGRDEELICSDGVALTCTGGKIGARDVCAQRSLTCVAGLGCRTCDPLTVGCQDNARYRCNGEGSALEFVEQCGDGLFCASLGCRDLCGEAAADRSYLGCEYWPVFTVNSALNPAFRPAVSIGNGNLVPAHVVIERGGAPVAQVEVAAHSAETVELEFEAALKVAGASRIVRAGAYHLLSDVPVTVHQFNPLLFEVASDCDDAEASLGTCRSYSYTNDASLLFPASALAPDPEAGDTGISYLAVSRASLTIDDPQDQQDAGTYSGFVAVVAVGPAPAVVRVRPRAYTLPSGPDDVEPVQSLAPGDTLERTLQPGDVLQLLSAVPSGCPGTQSGLYCDTGALFDLTGTEISADGPIQVLSGHDCTNVPFDRPACDHLEDALMPLRAWGTSAVVTRPYINGRDGYVLRVVSGADANTVSFDPAIQPPVVLDRGQFFELEASEPLYVSSTERLMVAQYLIGQGESRGVGDPSLAIAVPVDQYRASYYFISPATYRRNYVDIIATASDLVSFDGIVITNFDAVGQSRFRVATVELERSGAHELRGRGSTGLGVMLYGLAPYTSYMLPGGLALRSLAEPGI